jgi:hypothetical protein
MLLRRAPIVILLVLAVTGASSAGCSNGTTPVCDDAGSCLILEQSDDAGAPTPETGDDGPVE